MDTTRDELRFGSHVLRPAQRLLLRDGVPLKLGARAFDVLLALVEHRGRHVPKAELIERVWPDVVVEENNLEVHVWALRKLLGAQAIATLPGRGYRFALTVDGEGGAPATPAPARNATLPGRLPPLIGRDADLAALRHAADEHPLVTLTGEGGIGKSLLARHLLALERDGRPDGACWVDLAAVTEPSLVVPTMARALALSPAGADARRALAAAAAPLRLLMVVDNAEHLAAEVAATVQALLDGAPGVQMVVTSQLPLKLAQERLLRLGPLAAPKAPPTPDEAMTYGAVALFAERVSALQPRFTLDAHNVAAVCRLCQRLDGSPLAIALAAARVPLLGVQALEHALDERLDLLTKGHRDAPARHHSLRAALAWSHALLAAQEQQAFRRLGVFPASFTLDMAQQVAADADMDRWQLLGALDALVDVSLVAVQEGEPPRYRLLESPRALALEQLQASDEATALQQRHARAVQAHFLAVNLDFTEDRMTREQMVQTLAADLADGRAAMAWALQHEPTLAVALVAPLTNALGRQRGTEARALWAATEPLVRDDMPADLRLMWLLGAALFHFSEFRNPQACALAHQAVALARATGDRRRLALALGLIGSRDQAVGVDAQRAAIDEMRQILAEGVPLMTRVNGAQAEYIFHHAQGDLDACDAVGQRWLDLTRAPGWDYEHHVALSNMADLALVRGRMADAVALGRELEARLRGARQPRSLAVARTNLAMALLATGATAEARAVAEAGWPLSAGWRLEMYWGVALAQLAAQERRPRTAALLSGYAQARMAASGAPLEPNEAKALQHARELSEALLGATLFEALAQQGRDWPDDRVGPLALAATDLP